MVAKYAFGHAFCSGHRFQTGRCHETKCGKSCGTLRTFVGIDPEFANKFHDEDQETILRLIYERVIASTLTYDLLSSVINQFSSKQEKFGDSAIWFGRMLTSFSDKDLDVLRPYFLKPDNVGGSESLQTDRIMEAIWGWIKRWPEAEESITFWEYFLIERERPTVADVISQLEAPKNNHTTNPPSLQVRAPGSLQRSAIESFRIRKVTADISGMIRNWAYFEDPHHEQYA